MRVIKRKSKVNINLNPKKELPLLSMNLINRKKSQDLKLTKNFNNVIQEILCLI